MLAPSLRRSLPRRTCTVLAVSAALAAGCLSSSHQIHRGELTRLSQLDPAVRGDRVRVVQDFGEDDPPGAAPVEASTEVVVLPFHVHVGGGGHGHGGAARPPHGPGKPPHGGGGSSSSSSSGGDGESAAALAVVAIAVAASAVVVVGAIEGSRYDGFVRLHPMYPVHLYGAGGQHVVVPLSSIDADAVAWAERAVVVPGEGPWLDLGRAPLDRIGWNYSVLAGALQSVSADGQLGTGFGSHIQLGYFPTHQVGVLADLTLGWRDNAVGETLYDVRYGLEADVYPLSLGKLQGGCSWAPRWPRGSRTACRTPTTPGWRCPEAPSCSSSFRRGWR
jgi:hypothetical protein